MRILALIERSDSPDEAATVMHVAPQVLLKGANHIGFALQHLFDVIDCPGVLIRAFGTEVATSEFTPGVYEVELQAGVESVGLDENLWILSKDDYQMLLEEEISCAEPSSASLSRIGTRPALTQDSLTRIVREAFYQKLTGFICFKGTLLNLPKIDIQFDGGSDFSGDPLLYIAEVFADQCRDLLLFGAEMLALNVFFSGRLYRFGLQATFAKPVSPLIRNYFLSTSNSDLALVTQLLEKLLTNSVIQPGINIPEEIGFVSMSLELRGKSYVTAGGSG